MVKTISMMIPKIATTSAPTDKLEDGVVVVGGGVIVGWGVVVSGGVVVIGGVVVGGGVVEVGSVPDGWHW